jgi:Zn finger protein HypA/HybF involved in hydrogenase expression
MLLMTIFCIECGKKLENEQAEIGFCPECNAKIENDFHILSDSEDDSIAFLAETTF